MRELNRRAKSDFGLWLPLVSPAWTWDWPHLKLLRHYLNRVTIGEIDKLMVFMPPRHSKSETLTVRYPAWRLERDPALRIIVAAYSQTLAEKFSRKTRAIVRGRLGLSEERSAAHDWQTLAGGGLRAVGVGGGITGEGGGLIVIDDPVKSRAEAESATYREHVWDWYRDDLYTRREPGAAIILIMTRWHQDDLAGRILASEDGPNWTVLSLPALAEEDDPLGRSPGQALCPQRYDEEELGRIHLVLGERSFAAEYQQRPYPPGGNLIGRDRFPVVGAAPAEAERIRAWDLAATSRSAASRDPDWTVGTLLAHWEGVYYVEHVVRERVEPGAVVDLVVNTAAADGKGVRIELEQEGGSSGKIAANAIIRRLAGYGVFATAPTGDKVTRALPWLAQAEAGNLRLVRGPWNAAWLDEVCAVPLGPHDDQWDSMSAAFNGLTKPKVRIR